MPKEYITYPNVDQVKVFQTFLGMHDKDVDGKIGPRTREYWKEDIDDHLDRKMDRYDAVVLPPMVALHWDEINEVVQLSLDIDWDVLQEMVETRQKNPTANFADDNRFLMNRVTFYTGALDRKDLQRLVSASRRARNAVFGADE